MRICKFQEIFQAFYDLANRHIEAQHQSLSLASFISDIDYIVLYIISEVMKFREQNSTIYSLPPDKKYSHEYLPWTAMSGSTGLRDALSHLIDISIKYGARSTSDPELKQKIYQQILELIDVVLDGRKRYLDSVRDTEKYNVLLQQFESQRRELISLMSKWILQNFFINIYIYIRIFRLLNCYAVFINLAIVKFLGAFDSGTFLNYFLSAII